MRFEQQKKNWWTIPLTSSKVYIDAQWDPEEGNLGTLPIAMQVSSFLTVYESFMNVIKQSVFNAAGDNPYVWSWGCFPQPRVSGNAQRLCSPTSQMYHHIHDTNHLYLMSPSMFSSRPLPRSWPPSSQSEPSRLQIASTRTTSTTGSMWSCRSVLIIPSSKKNWDEKA